MKKPKTEQLEPPPPGELQPLPELQVKPEYMTLAVEAREDGTPEVDASLNKLASHGWRVVSAYAVSRMTTTIVTHHYLLERSIYLIEAEAADAE